MEISTLCGNTKATGYPESSVQLSQQLHTRAFVMKEEALGWKQAVSS